MLCFVTAGKHGSTWFTSGQTNTPCRLCNYSSKVHQHVGQVCGLKCCRHCTQQLALKAHSSDTTNSAACCRTYWIRQHRCRHPCSDARPPSPSRAPTLRPSPANTLQLKPKLPQLQVLLAVNPHIISGWAFKVHQSRLPMTSVRYSPQLAKLTFGSGMQTCTIESPSKDFYMFCSC